MMSRDVRAEALKIRTTRTTLALLLVASGLVLLFTLVTVGFSGADNAAGMPALSSEDGQRTLLSTGAVAGLFAVIVGALVVTTEYRHGTIGWSAMTTPDPARLVMAKATVALVTGIVFGVAGAAVALASGLAGLGAIGEPLLLDHAILRSLALGAVAYAAIGGALGVAVGALVRNQVGAIVIVLVTLQVADPLLAAAVPAIARFGPGGAARALTGTPGDQLLAPAVAGALLAVYAVFLLAAAITVARARDIG